jgi:hypothetical protein
MMRPTWKTVLSCLPVLAASRLGAQATACAPTSVVISAGIGQSDRVDMTASPTQFGGRGLDLAADIEQARGAFCVVAGGRAGAKTLSAVTPSAASEHLMDGDAHVAVLRAVAGSAPSRRVLALGVDIRATLALTEHAYADPAHTVAEFRLATLSVGPVLRWRERIGNGFAVAQISAPAIAVVDHPYSTMVPSPDLRLVSIGALRGAEGFIAYEPFPNRAIAPRAAYRVGVLRYDDVRPVRSLTQAITLGVVTRLGARNR